MINVDMKSLLMKLNGFCATSLQNAAGLCVSRTNYEVMVEHFFLKCLETPGSDMPLILKRFEIDPGRLMQALTASLEDIKTGNAGKPTFSPLLIELFESAWLVNSIDLTEAKIRSGGVLMAFLSKPTFFSSGLWVDIIKAVNLQTLKDEFFTIVKTSQEKAVHATAAPGEGETPSGEDTFIGRYCQDFTAKAREGNIDPVFGRDHEIRQIVDVLGRRRKNNPILVGEPGVGKTAVIEGLALRITQNDVPEMLSGVTLLGLDMGALEAGAGMKGEFENRLKGVLNEIKASEKPIVLFIDEAHTLVGAGGAAGGSDAANLLKPALARGELKTCAATTWSEYKKYFEKDPALARRFQLIKLAEPDVKTATIILQGLKDMFEKAHGVVMRNDAIESAAIFADKYITGRFLPDKAIDLLDTAGARVKINLTDKPSSLEDLERSIQAKERVKKTLERDRDDGVKIDEDELSDVLAAIDDLTAKAEALRARWLAEKDAVKALLDIRTQIHGLTEDTADQKADLEKQLAEAESALAETRKDGQLIQIEVNPDVIGQIVSDWTGIPLGKVQRDESKTILNLEERLKTRIKGQDQALAVVTKVIQSAKSGIKNPNQPLGVFLLVGPSGVGKTETGLSLADLLFGGEKNIVTINMSEFKESHTVSRLIGSPPGYVGYGEGGMLTEAVRQQPYSVVLLDEVEKAHLSVMELFYQVFDKGMLADGEGKDINFKNTVIILTSNLGSDVIQEMTKDGEMPMDALMGALRPILSQHFKPALLARMTIAPYYDLNPDAMKGITVLKLNKLKQTLLENNKMTLTWGDAVVDQITARCTETETGARNIEYILNGNVLPKLSQTILEHLSEGQMPAKAHIDVSDDGSFIFSFDDTPSAAVQPAADDTADAS
ncbi:type VI secretion system ATPase TssH [Desulfovibrio inopinatus]|uniref:type VI secretion system ATPase TssH n=1 Tax=Desulfovibrio inopinatus TaxID=102109 RepID=UPI00040EC072|nr:type VI secretion system ATPase TssH [Desulfovibrio inopinatus]